MATTQNNVSPVTWPKRAVVTAGMPYGNKPLHFGHVAGVFVPADCFARFLRDRIGAENVRFISGTDCFGSPINEGYRKLVEAGEFTGTIEEYVERNHNKQKATLDSYDISLNIYEGSNIGHSGEVHQGISEAFIKKLHENGWLHKRSTLQFYDPQAGTFLNGRQVQGHCPVQGCKSEHAYADECDLGHSFAPEDLIAPKSSLTGVTPEMRPVENWYFDLPAFTEFLKKHVEALEADPEVRPIVPQTIKEFLAPPVVYIKNELHDQYLAIADKLPHHVFHEAEKGKQSFEIEFDNIDDRDAARDVLTGAQIRFRTGKALVPFRITGNIEWGVKAPVIDGLEGLTVWCWPESLWAPMSFTMAVNDKMGLPRGSWRDFWCSEDSEVYQFIGQDNLYFYGVAQPALIEALRPGDILTPGETDHPIRQTKLVANHHILLGNKKASSSGAVKPPTADELLEYYTVEQLRAHFLALGLDQKSVGFKPKPFDPDESKREDPRVADPVLKEGALLTNIFNRIARSCFYTAQKWTDGKAPLGGPGEEVSQACEAAVLEFEQHMHRFEIWAAMAQMDEFLRGINKWWSSASRAVLNGDNPEQDIVSVLRDAFHYLRIACVLMHPIVPHGTELIYEYLDIADHGSKEGHAGFFSWTHIFEPIDSWAEDAERQSGWFTLQEVPPRFDFFEKHPSQL